MHVERRLEELGLAVPPPASFRAGVDIPFAWVRVRGNQAFVSGHGAPGLDRNRAAQPLVVISAEIEIVTSDPKSA
jgi:hypothetical protein